MDNYVAVLTTNNKMYELLDVFYSHITFKKIHNVQNFVNDAQCIALFWDYSASDNIDKIFPEINKPIILFSSLLDDEEDYYNLHINFSKISPFKKDTLNKKFNDLYMLSNDIYFSIEKHSIITSNSTYLLTNLEFRLLYYLLKMEGKVVSADLLMSKLDLFSTSSLYVCIKKLREKLETDPSSPSLLLHHNKLGYSLNVSNINKSLVES